MESNFLSINMNSSRRYLLKRLYRLLSGLTLLLVVGLRNLDLLGIYLRPRGSN
jgi:hypothetical protein